MRVTGKPVARVPKFVKSERPSENHQPLRKLMREWTVTTPLPPRFQEGVWARIERAEAAVLTKVTLWSAFMASLAAALPRPAVAVAYVMMLFFVGVATGVWQVRNQTARLDGELGTRYVQSVDPYQKPRL